MLSVFIVLACLSVFNNAYGKETDYSEALEECENSVTHYCRSQGIHYDYAIADETLNESYQKLLKAIKEGLEANRLKEALVTSQRSWIQFRDKACDFVALIEEPGSREGRSVKCLVNLTVERRKQIDEYLQCLENNDDECRYDFP